jgi:hypothetical protein
VSQPAARPSEPTPPAVHPAKGDDAQKSSPTVAKRLQPPASEATARQGSANDKAAAVKSSPVISKSSRVRELPAPPVIASPMRDTGGLQEKQLPPPIELEALQIAAPGGRSLFRRRVRLPPRWEQWLADPQRRNGVGLGAGLMLVTLIVLLGLVLRSPLHFSAAETLEARTVLPAGGELAFAGSDRVLPHEPIVQQLAAAKLETLAIGLPEAAGPSTSDLKSATPHLDTKIEPPKIAADADNPRTGAETPPAVPPGDDSLPGMAPGSRMPPDLMEAIDAAMQGKFKRRTKGGRSEGVRYGGGTTKSEEAVELALHWLAAHQRVDGSWSFNHLNENCQHYCTHPGSEGSTTASTALALLPYLGAGYTHKQGDYADIIQKGLNYIKSRGMTISYGNDLRDGSMYGHALATIALCEAYGMTRDEDLKAAAQGGLDYIAYVQDNHTGGWRYNPGESGDTTVTGWMLMALKSGQMAGLNVQSPAIFGAEKFLDSVQNQDGSQYGYQSRKPRPATTAVGLLCRMYTGWRRDNPGLIKGVAYLHSLGPSPESLYYDYYATQVLFHWAGPEWEPWNRKMRERLISTQERVGHQSGSWYFESPQSAAGGRLYNTAMATMILEVYYRFMPLYGENAVDGRQ